MSAADEPYTDVLPGSPGEVCDLAGSLFAQARYAAVVTATTAGLRLASNAWLLYVWRGDAHTVLQHWQDALRDFERAKDHLRVSAAYRWGSRSAKQWVADVYARIAGAHLALREPRAAGKNADQAINEDPACGRAYFYRAEAYQWLGKREKARADQKTCAAHRSEYLPLPSWAVWMVEEQRFAAAPAPSSDDETPNDLWWI